MDAGVLAMLIPIAAIVCGTYVTVERMKSKRMSGSNPDTDHRLAELENEVAQMQERLDFAERILAKQKDQGKLGA